MQGSGLQPQEEFQHQAKTDGKSQTLLKAIRVYKCHTCSGLQRQRGRALNRKTSVRISLSITTKKKIPLAAILHSRELRVEHQNSQADMKVTGKRLTPPHSSRGSDLTSSQKKVSIPSFLARFLPARRTDRYRVSLFFQTHILLASVFPTNLHYKKKKRKTVSSHSSAHYSSLQKRK